MDMFEQDNNIYKDYKQDEKPSKKKIVTIVVISVLVLALVAGMAFFGGTLYSANSTVESEMPMVKTVLDALNKYYINDIDWEQFQYAVAEAVAGSVDRFTGLVEMTPTGVKSMSMGITFGYNDYCNYYISEISPVSPAAKAVNVYDNGTSGNVKLKVGDEVVALNGYTIQHLNSASFSQLLSTLGNTVRLDVVRRNADGNVSGYYTYKIDKEMFHSPLAYYLGSDVTGLPSNVGYIRLNEFSDTAPDDFAAAVKEFLADENRPSKLVLDLRGNGGGAVTMCGFIASYFVSQNGTTSGIPMAKYVYNAGGGDKQETYFYTQDTYVSDLTGETIKSVNLYDEVEGFDCVILVNGSSASSSELLTSVLSYYCGVKTVGSNTFGKGVAQISITYEKVQYELYITNGMYYVPSTKNGQTVFETNFHGVGIAPDYEADTTGVYYMNLDPCFLKAAELLTAASGETTPLAA